jgi:hypothetical protein
VWQVYCSLPLTISLRERDADWRCADNLCLAVLDPTTTERTLHANAGGRGKSTLAKVLFNRLAGSFPHNAFIEIQQGDDADKTAHHLVSALEGLGASGAASYGVPKLSSMLKELVRDKKVLLVLDNVWEAGQLTALLPTAWGPGSTVIVTSRSARFTDSDAWRQVGSFPCCACLAGISL